jgi:hypothetical protein
MNFYFDINFDRHDKYDRSETDSFSH